MRYQKVPLLKIVSWDGAETLKAVKTSEKSGS